MSTRRFYSPGISPESSTIELDEIQSAHLRTVLRLEIGAAVRVFDGRGNEFECRVIENKGKISQLEVTNTVPASAPESALILTLGVPLIKSANTELIVRKAVELGVTGVVPVVTDHCGSYSKRFNKERWEKIIIESSKQCGRAHLMTVAGQTGFEEFVLGCSGSRFLFSERAGEKLPESIEGHQAAAAIGPEGGWTDSEINFSLANGFSVVHFGGRILRAETAAIVIAGILQHRYGDMN